MFDIGLWEIGLLMIIGLLVIGPERLPKVARTVGLLLGKARGIVRSVKADVQRELAAEELKQALSKQAQSNPLHDIVEETRSVVKDAESSLNEATEAARKQPGPSADTEDEAQATDSGEQERKPEEKSDTTP